MSLLKGRSALLFSVVTFAAVSCGGGAAKEKNQGGVGPWCGAPKATQFDVVVNGVLIAPFDFNDEQWDFDGDIGGWYDEYELWIDLALTMSGQSALVWDEVIHAADPFAETLFSAYVAPDVFIDWYSVTATGDLYVDSWIDFPEDQSRVGPLNLGTVAPVGTEMEWFEAHDSDLTFDDYAGYFYLDQDMLREAADCGEVVYFYSQNDMNAYETRVNAFAVDVIALD
jgi:hypothetical protein